MKVIIFDGHNLLFQYYYGMPPFIKSRSGDLIHGALGFVSCIIRHLKDRENILPLVCFDMQERTQKEVLHPDYKKSRIKEFFDGDNPFSQLDVILSALKHLNIQAISINGVEADDLIGTYASFFAKNGHDVIIHSNDTDFLQLVDEKIFVHREYGKKITIFTTEMIKERFGVLPNQIVDYKSLIGDVSDDIPGIRGIGPKISAQLINKYETIDGIIDNLDNLTPSLAAKIRTNIARLITNRYLIKIECEQSVPNIEIDSTFKLVSNTSKEVFQRIGVW